MPIRTDAWPQGTPCWIDCQVSDPAKAGEFYAELFGWQIQESGPESGGYLMAAKDGAAVAGIGPKPESMAGLPSVWTTYFAVADADRTGHDVEQAGGTLVVPIFDVMEFGRMFVAADPGGAVFAVWQAMAHNGAAVYNEHGAYVWNDLHTRDVAAAKAFYANVFGYRYTDYRIGTAAYSTFTPPERTESVGGIAERTDGGDNATPYWLTWFQFEDVDAGVATAAELGATVLQQPQDSPVGRSAMIAAPQGEAFGIIDPSRAVGKMPAPVTDSA